MLLLSSLADYAPFSHWAQISRAFDLWLKVCDHSKGMACVTSPKSPFRPGRQSLFAGTRQSLIKRPPTEQLVLQHRSMGKYGLAFEADGKLGLFRTRSRMREFAIWVQSLIYVAAGEWNANALGTRLWKPVWEFVRVNSYMSRCLVQFKTNGYFDFL